MVFKIEAAWPGVKVFILWVALLLTADDVAAGVLSSC